MRELQVLDVAAAISLFLMMGVVGIELALEDFRRVAQRPRVVVVGTVAQWTLLPAISALLLFVVPVEPHIAAGLILLTAAPGGGISNVFAYLSGAHTALSVTLTACTSLAAAVVLPILTGWGFALFVGEQEIGGVPVLQMTGQLVVLVLLPIGLGMWLRGRRPDVAERLSRPFRRAVLVGLVVLLAAGFAGDDGGLVGDLVGSLGLAGAWTVLAFGAGWGTAAALGLDERDRFTFGIEFSVKNVGLTAIVALAGFDRPEFAVLAGAYVVTGYPMAAVASVVRRRLTAARA